MRVGARTHFSFARDHGGAMFYAKMNDDEDDELPHFEAEDDEEGAERPHVDIIEDVEEVVIDEEPDEDGDEEVRPVAAVRKPAPVAKAKKAKASKKSKKPAAKPKKKKAKSKKKAPAKKAKAKKKA